MNLEKDLPRLDVYLSVEYAWIETDEPGISTGKTKVMEGRTQNRTRKWTEASTIRKSRSGDGKSESVRIRLVFVPESRPRQQPCVPCVSTLNPDLGDIGARS